MRNPQLKEGYIYHVFTKSIAGFKVFRRKSDYLRFIETIKFYRYFKPPARLSTYLTLKDKKKFFLVYMNDIPQVVDILAYCLMPTHVHVLLVQTYKDGISRFMKCVLDSYTRYFNVKTNRKGPLWQSRFKHVLIEGEEQLMHTTRYIHLNPTTEHLVNRPEDWQFSSYREYIGLTKERLCNFEKYLEILPEYYRKFVEDQIEYQQALKSVVK
jgi:putative transposase